MIIPDPYWKIKKAAKFLGVFLLIAGLLTLAIISYQKTKQKVVEKNGNASMGASKTSEEKQRAMLDAINKASQEGMKESGAPNGEQDKKQQEMKGTIEKANQGTQSASQKEAAKKSQDMTNAINAANKK